MSWLSDIFSPIGDAISTVGNGIWGGIKDVGHAVAPMLGTLGGLAGTALGGPMGGMMGGSLGNMVGGLFGGGGGGGGGGQQQQQQPMDMSQFGQQMGGQMGGWMQNQMNPYMQGMGGNTPFNQMAPQYGQGMGQRFGNWMNNQLSPYFGNMDLGNRFGQYGQQAGNWFNNQFENALPQSMQGMGYSSPSSMFRDAGERGGRYMGGGEGYIPVAPQAPQAPEFTQGGYYGVPQAPQAPQAPEFPRGGYYGRGVSNTHGNRGDSMGPPPSYDQAVSDYANQYGGSRAPEAPMQLPDFSRRGGYYGSRGYARGGRVGSNLRDFMQMNYA